MISIRRRHRRFARFHILFLDQLLVTSAIAAQLRAIPTVVCRLRPQVTCIRGAGWGLDEVLVL
jgi:hypothetical protein